MILGGESVADGRTTIYVSLDGPTGHLSIDGSLDMLRRFLDAVGDRPEDRADVKADLREAVAVSNRATSVTPRGKEATDAPSA
jgi:hypothetical protein